MTIQEARKNIIHELINNYDGNEAMNIAELVLENITGFNRSALIINRDQVITKEQTETLENIINRLKKNEPVQYVLKEAWFAGMKFKVNKNVLIPRPETEELVDWIISECRKLIADIKILDIGTGSGCIPISLKKKLPGADVSALDVCSEALFTATENAMALDTEIDFKLMDFLNEEAWKELDQYDIIVSNPPYVKNSEGNTMHERVTTFEPHLALFVPDEDALIFYRKLADFTRKHLKPHGSLFVEINEGLGNDVLQLFESKRFNSVLLRKDLQGKERMIKATL